MPATRVAKQLGYNSAEAMYYHMERGEVEEFKLYTKSRRSHGSIQSIISLLQLESADDLCHVLGITKRQFTRHHKIRSFRWFDPRKFRRAGERDQWAASMLVLGIHKEFSGPNQKVAKRGAEKLCKQFAAPGE